MNFKKSFVIKFQRSELLWKEKKYFVARNRNKKDDTNPRRKVKDYFCFFRWLDSLKGSTMRQIHFQVASLQNQKSRFLYKLTTFMSKTMGGCCL